MKIAAFLLIFFVSSLAFAGQFGILTGTVTDSLTGEALPGVNILLEGTTFGAASDVNGAYKIIDIPPGAYTLTATMLGYAQVSIDKVRIFADSTVVVDVKLSPAQIEGKEVIVTAERERAKMDVTSSLALSIAPRPYPAQPSFWVPHNTEEYDRIYETGFLDVIEQPLSTFAADVDAASYGNARRFIMDNQIPPKDVVRIEEFVNYFDYDYPQPVGDNPLSINLEYSDCPWNAEHKLVHIGLQGKKLGREEQKPSNLVFLIDVSGSMDQPNKLPLLKMSFKMLIDQLTEKDRIAIVVYAGNAGLVLPATSGKDKRKIRDAVEELQAGGSTAGGEGIQLAYKVAKENYINGGNNRVILATDGDFNVGISNTAELVRFIEEEKEHGIFLTVLGFGDGNYKDNRLQELADRGNGNHAYIDNIMEAKKVLVNEITATLFTIAKDVKIQVEFNPTKIKSYRLIGYENRRLENKDFTDDKKDAGEIGAGHRVTALYEVIPATAADAAKTLELKYQENKPRELASASLEILTVRIRYKTPDGEKSTEFSEVLTEAAAFAQASNNLQFSACVAEFAMILRDSEFKANASLDHVLVLAKQTKGDDPFGYRAEFINLVERSQLLLKE